jgi:hypothetical protein
LDTLIGPDLVSTYDNIKLFAANQVSVQENFLTSLIGWLGNTARPLWIKATGGDYRCICSSRFFYCYDVVS